MRAARFLLLDVDRARGVCCITRRTDFEHRAKSSTYTRPQYVKKARKRERAGLLIYPINTIIILSVAR